MKFDVCATLQHSAYLVGGSPASAYTITAKPSLKQAYRERTGKDLLEVVQQAVLVLPVVLHTFIQNRAVHVMARCKHKTEPGYHTDIYETTESIDKLLRREWLKPKPEPVGCPTLQVFMLNKLQDPEYKLESCLYHAKAHGADLTFDVLRLLNDWSGS